ncbi:MULTISPECIES: sensor histidine kinase [Paenibacillus]|uniref:sensor histidine kinase n=1 Tax=Paenibacillus TaxID=44249 RepID=UPI0022B93563|nr:histidine kinase [Paenibacillus caseinilyticus]MCZ8522651.1 histidine kinase [Paenibacillus caseinilyticus]
MTLFGRMLLTLVLLLVPVLLLYGHSNRIATGVVEEQLRSSNLNQLSFFLYQLDGHIENLSMLPVVLGHDPYVREFIEGGENGTEGSRLKAESRVTEKLGLQSVSSSWSNDVTFVIPSRKTVFSSNIFINGSGDWPWEAEIRKKWTYGEDESRGRRVPTFYREIVEPAGARTASAADSLFQVGFPAQNISDLLDIYKKDKSNDPFLYHKDHPPIWNSTPSREVMDSIIRDVLSGPLPDAGQRTVEIQGEAYLVSYVKSRQLGWYLVDYVPLEKVLAPIASARSWFYGAAAVLLAAGAAASYLLYRNVQLPIRNLIRGVRRMKEGDLSSRIAYRADNEFDDLIGHYNEMAEQIQRLIEDVYTEKLRSREATLKQLQSQINPHFLYNSLFFIINSAMLDDRDSVTAMAHHLAEYYRYTTRVENQQVTLRDELELVGHYLSIHHLRMHRLEYTVQVPEEMMGEPVPRLLLQPIVENAVVHGIEARAGGGAIWITGEQDGEYNRMIVEDNGAALTEAKLREMKAGLQEEEAGDMGCGTWNVHRRLQMGFGEGAGLTFEPAAGGGLRAILVWNRTPRLHMKAQEEGGDADGTAAHRG